MLEEHIMEKKNLNRLQTPAKGSATEVKKNPDAQNSKLFPRSNRKREPPGNNASKYDQSRRPPPQKSKTCDKRPKPRGLYYSSRKEGTQINDEEDLESEFGQLYSQHEFGGGSKKQSLNHLLNFHSYSLQNSGGRAMRGGAAVFIGSGSSAMRQTYKQYTTKSLMSTHAHKYNKEQFLQANCQFVVRASGDYALNMVDPDLLVDWEQVELIRVWSGDGATTTCPICLYPPVAAKITRCGHVFCWTCALHYLALSDKTWRKCPICYEAVHINDLKSVECVEKTQFSVGQEITLQLMKREKGSLIVTPALQSESRSSRGPILNLSETELDTVYSKLLLAEQTDIDYILDQEYAHLQEQVMEFTGCPELCFVEQALEALTLRRTRKEQKVETNYSETKTAEIANDTACTIHSAESLECIDHLEEPVKRESSSEESESIILPHGIQSENTSSSSEEITVADLYISNTSKTASQPTKYFYFYQSVDGQQIYLHSINVHMLQSTYGSLEDCPPLIVGKIVEKETGSMTSELRHRLRYMQHVPITCQFDVVELDLKPPVISVDALTLFQDQIDNRRRRRQRQERAEKRRERRIEEAERRKYGRSGQHAVDLRIESHFHFPECGSDIIVDQQGLEEVAAQAAEHRSEPVESGSSSRSISPSLMSKDPTLAAVAALSLESEHDLPSGSGVSFAQMLREGKTMRNDANGWPSVSNSGGDGGKWVQHQTSTGGQSRSRQRQPSLPTVTDSDDCSFSPPAKPSFSIADALRAASAAASDKVQDSGGRKKKKKQQKVLLFTTGMPCANGGNN